MEDKELTSIFNDILKLLFFFPSENDVYCWITKNNLCITSENFQQIYINGQNKIYSHIRLVKMKLEECLKSSNLKDMYYKIFSLNMLERNYYCVRRLLPNENELNLELQNQLICELYNESTFAAKLALNNFKKIFNQIVSHRKKLILSASKRIFKEHNIQELIADFLKSNSISHLIHFTPIYNLRSIFQYKLSPVLFLENLDILYKINKSDFEKKEKEFVHLTILFPSEELSRYQEIYKKRNYSFIYIDSKILFQNFEKVYIRNKKYGFDIIPLKSFFKENNKNDIEILQALFDDLNTEVLYRDSIELEYIKDIKDINGSKIAYDDLPNPNECFDLSLEEQKKFLIPTQKIEITSEQFEDKNTCVDLNVEENKDFNKLYYNFDKPINNSRLKYYFENFNDVEDNEESVNGRNNKTKKMIEFYLGNLDHGYLDDLDDEEVLEHFE